MSAALEIDGYMTGRDFLVLGAGRSGLAVCRLLHAAGAQATLVDDKKSPEEIARALNLPDVTIVPPGYQASQLTAQALVLSPGIPDSHPLVAAFLEQGLPVLSEVELASQLTTSPVIAVTGSNGKSTVATLIHRMMASSDFRSFLGGNIGVPFASNVLEEHALHPPSPVHVVEVSSFQAEHLNTFKPRVAVFLNLSADHLDRYPSLEIYGQAKLQLAKNIAASGWVVYNRDDPFFTAAFEGRVGAVHFSTGAPESAWTIHQGKWITLRGEPVVPLAELVLPGAHNVSNYLAAATAAHLMEAKVSAIVHVMRQFTGLPHRLELVAEIAGVRYYNDSKATNVASTRVALASFSKDIILILGGSDKGTSDYPQLTDQLRKQVKLLITYGEVGLHLAEMYQGIVPIRFEERFTLAVEQAHKAAQPGDLVLLSPASASFDQFADFEQRGETFRQFIETYQQQAIHA
ncbi:MAG: UDP-N-acetylmuramoyl-L-alanine--D-glutamate ligase [Candidatus Marinimicrobia bacterium]|nr:UDP-N-acetylmuramoyl-L-alanine--D-glutamate ligase [Candidatus Neomarinimicrobiota bacterium]